LVNCGRGAQRNAADSETPFPSQSTGHRTRRSESLTLRRGRSASGSRTRRSWCR